MRTRNALERLAAVAPAEPLLDAREEDRILGRIVAAERLHVRRRRPIAIALVAAAVVGATVVAVVAHGHTAPPVKSVGGHHRVPLTGARITLAGYHFQTPAGFASSSDACESATPTPPGSPETPAHSMRAAASADGGCVEAYFLVYGDGTTPGDIGGTPVDVGAFQGYYVPQVASSGKSALYVELPQANGSQPVYLVLFAQELTEDQLIAVGQSGLPASS